MIRVTILLFLLSATFYFGETKPTKIGDSNQGIGVKEKVELKDCKYGWTKNTHGESVCLKGKLLNRLENI